MTALYQHSAFTLFGVLHTLLVYFDDPSVHSCAPMPECLWFMGVAPCACCRTAVGHSRSAWDHETLSIPMNISFKLHLICDDDPDEAPLAIFAGPGWRLKSLQTINHTSSTDLSHQIRPPRHPCCPWKLRLAFTAALHLAGPRWIGMGKLREAAR